MALLRARTAPVMHMIDTGYPLRASIPMCYTLLRLSSRAVRARRLHFT